MRTSPMVNAGGALRLARSGFVRLACLHKTRTRPIKVVSQHEIKIGVSHRNRAGGPINGGYLALKSF